MNIFSAQSHRALFVWQRVHSGRLGMVGFAVAALLLIAGPAQATITYDTALAAPPGTYYGSGNPNTHWVVDNENDAEIGLKTLIRYTGSLAPMPVSSGTYYVPIGATTVAGKTGSAWGFAFSLNLSGAGLVLNDVTTSLQMQDLANGTTGSFDALLLLDNYGYSSSGRDGGSSMPDATKDYGFQNSEALSYASIAAAFGAVYDMDQNNTYKFQFSVTCKAGTRCAGQQLASVNSTVIAGTGAPLPEHRHLRRRIACPAGPELGSASARARHGYARGLTLSITTPSGRPPWAARMD